MTLHAAAPVAKSAETGTVSTPVDASSSSGAPSPLAEDTTVPPEARRFNIWQTSEAAVASAALANKIVDGA